MKQWDVPKPSIRKSQQSSGFSFRGILKLIFALIIIFFISFYLDYNLETKIVIKGETKKAPSFSTSFPAALVDFSFSKEQPLEAEQKGRINFLLLGIPGQGNPAPYLTDTIIFASFFPETKKMYLVSLPRDWLVKMPGTERFSRINSLYLYGLLQKPETPLEPLKEKIKEVTGQEIDYYAVVDLNLFERVVDLVGGIEVFLENDIYDPNFPGENFSFDPFKLEKGFHILDGKTAAKYIRTRNSFYGDFDRVKRQKEVISSLIGKVQSLNPVFDFKTYLDLYSELQAHFFTNLTYSDLKRLYTLAKDLRGKNIFEYSIGISSPTDFLKEYHNGAYYLIPKDGIENYEKIKEFFASFTP